MLLRDSRRRRRLWAVGATRATDGAVLMTIRSRLGRLKRSLGDRPPPGQLDRVVAVPVGCGMADDLTPGVHFAADGRVAMVVFEGAERDGAVMAGLETWMPGWGCRSPAGRGKTGRPGAARISHAGPSRAGSSPGEPPTGGRRAPPLPNPS